MPPNICGSCGTVGNPRLAEASLWLPVLPFLGRAAGGAWVCGYVEGCEVEFYTGERHWCWDSLSYQRLLEGGLCLNEHVFLFLKFWPTSSEFFVFFFAKKSRYLYFNQSLFIISDIINGLSWCWKKISCSKLTFYFIGTEKVSDTWSCSLSHTEGISMEGHGYMTGGEWSVDSLHFLSEHCIPLIKGNHENLLQKILLKRVVLAH